MAFEERIISFYLDETHNMLLENKSNISPEIQKNLKKLSIIGVDHTSTIHTRPEQKSRYEEVMKIPRDKRATLFYCTQKGLWNGRNQGFFIEDHDMINILSNACIKEGITIPRQGERSIISSDFHVSLKIKLTGKEPFEFEEAR